MKCNKQRNICVALLKKTRKEYYEDLRLTDVNDNKKFWKTAKPLLGNKLENKSQIALVEGNILATEDKALVRLISFLSILLSILELSMKIYPQTTMIVITNLMSKL